MRQCIGCMQQKEKSELVRIARIAANQFVIDKSGKKNGRGAYICDSLACMELCMKRHGLDKAFCERVEKEAYEALLTDIKAERED